MIFDNPNVRWYQKAAELEGTDYVPHCIGLLAEYVRGDVLDIGAGQGTLTIELTTQASSVTVIEGSDYNIGFLRLRNVGTIIKHDIDKHPYPVQQEFDTIIITDVIEHTLSPYLLLVECNRLLKKGGTLIVTTPDAHHTEVTIPHIGYFCEESLLKLTARTGFSPVKRVYNGIFGETTTSLINKVPLLKKCFVDGMYFVFEKQKYTFETNDEAYDDTRYDDLGARR